MQQRSIPAALAALPQWVCWGAPGRPRKCPFDPRSGTPAKAGQPDTWADLLTAITAVNAGRYEGVGFEFAEGGGIVGIDFDHCIRGGKLLPWAAGWVQRLDSYTEVSPSGEGLHVFCLGALPGAGVKRPRAEMYDRARYFTVTGQPWGTVKPLRAAQDAINALWGELQAEARKAALGPAQPRTAPPAGQDTGRTLQDGLAHDEKFAVLWRGERPNGNESSDDQALMNKLAYWCSCDAAAMQAAFMASPHYQGKDAAHQKKADPSRRADYLQRTIQSAINTCPRTAAQANAEYQTRRASGAGMALDWDGSPETPGGQAAAPSVRPRLVCASDVPYEPPRWTIEPYFQKGKGTMIQGDNGAGKTAFMCGIAAHVTTGTPLLGLPIASPGAVVMLSVEDDLPVLRGRIEASGGDLTRCHFMTNAAGLTFTSPEIEQAVAQVEARMLIFDPIQAFMGSKVDMFRANETRPQLAQLFEMCDRHDCACVIISHMGKARGEKTPVNRSLGSVDIPAAMRSILELTKDPDNDEQRVMVHVKCSNAPKGHSIVYTIGERGGIHWVGFSEMTVEDLAIAQTRKQKGIPYEKEPLVQVFNQLITDKPGGGFWSYAELQNEGAKMLGFPPYNSIGDLKQRLESGLARELQVQDGIIVTAGVKGRGNVRGVKIEQYQQPKSFQAKMEDV